MKFKLTTVFIALLIIGCKEKTSKQNVHQHSEHETEQTVAEQKKVLSPHTSAMAMIGDAHIHIDYSSPGVRDRIIFGGLLAYDQVWQAGAHMATWIETNKDLQIEGNILPAGKYGFFTIPSKEEWTIIFNKNWNQHGKDEYDEKDDVFRVKVRPIYLDEIKEHLEYKVLKVDDVQGEISLAWEKVSVSFNFKIKQ